MMRTSRIGALVLALVVLLVAPTTAALARIDRPVPLHGSATTADSMLEPVDCPEGSGWRYAATGEGRFSHLGSVDVELTHCSRMTSELTGEFGSGTTILTAANGDVLTLSQSGTFTLSFGPDGFYSYVDLQWEVIGGTGRFLDATGSGTATAVGDLLAETTTADYDGTIVYAASNRSTR
jgi:hypothetical protein